jgi:hypothetical protein
MQKSICAYQQQGRTPSSLIIMIGVMQIMCVTRDNLLQRQSNFFLSAGEGKTVLPVLY